MRILYLGNNWVGWKLLEVLKQRGEDVVGVVVHPPGRTKHRDDILRVAGLDPTRVFDASDLGRAEVLATIEALRPDIGICGCFGYLLRAQLLKIFPLGCINSHISLLPYNRGAFPNVWSIIDGTPAGVSLHYVDAGVDMGDIVAQAEVPVELTDTGETLYRKLENAAVELFARSWHAIRSGEVVRRIQDHSKATSHRVADVSCVDEIDLDRSYPARQLIDLIRARTFPPHRGAYVVVDGRKVYLQIHLFEDIEGTTEHG